MDKAILKTEDINALLSWRDDHQDLVRSMPCSLKGIEIILPDSRYVIKGVRDKGKISLYLSQNGASICKARFDLVQLDGKNQLAQTSVTGEKLSQEDMNSVITVYCSLMALMAYGSDTPNAYALRKNPPARGAEKPVKTAGKPSGKHQPSVTYLMRRRGNMPTLTPIGTHASPTGIFSVRGHYRHYKNGTVIWIDEYKKGIGKRKNKTYKIGRKEEWEENSCT